MLTSISSDDEAKIGRSSLGIVEGGDGAVDHDETARRLLPAQFAFLLVVCEKNWFSKCALTWELQWCSRP